MSDTSVVDLKTFLNDHYKLNPFSHQWPWSRVSKKHMHKIDEDNQWYQMVMGHTQPVKEKQYEPAPF